VIHRLATADEHFAAARRLDYWASIAIVRGETERGARLVAEAEEMRKAGERLREMTEGREA
jgi:hypothetical protein